jgi:orotate phosphoribosyltransferase
MTNSNLITHYLLQSKAIKLEPAKPFTWASGWKSPVYCDNRVTLSYPEIRKAITDAFVEKIKLYFPSVEVIVGVATGAIAQGVLVADELNLPFAYVRSAPKSHGMGNLIEGIVEFNQKVVVIEDLVSTGGSSLQAVEALRATGADVLGMLAIFTYEFQVAVNNFKANKCTLITLTNYNELIDMALKTNYIQPDHIELLTEWRLHPDSWMK